jgi:hypothetical protein
MKTISFFSKINRNTMQNERNTSGIQQSKYNFIYFAMLLFFSVKSQYVVTVSSQTYSNLVGATPLSYNAVDDGYYYSANFIFPTFNRNADFNININPPSLGGFLSSEGYLAVYEKPGYLNTVAYQCFYASTFTTAPGITFVSAKIEGSGTNRIAKFEWKDVVKGSDLSQRVNFQIWLHEKDSSISYHYGPNTLTSQAINGWCGMVVINPAFTGLLDEINIEGSPTTPTTYTGITTFNFPSLDTIPKNNTVIWFAHRTKTTSLVGISKNIETKTIVIHPNPFQNNFFIDGLSGQTNIIIYDALGRLVLEKAVETPWQEISTENLQKGVYTLKLVYEEGTLTRKVIKY